MQGSSGRQGRRQGREGKESLSAATNRIRKCRLSDRVEMLVILHFHFPVPVVARCVRCNSNLQQLQQWQRQTACAVSGISGPTPLPYPTVPLLGLP